MRGSVKCEACGLFIPYSEMQAGGGATLEFEPSSHFGPEILEWTCAACTEKEDQARGVSNG